VKLIERPVRSIVRAIADAAERWVNADFPPRVRALDAVCKRTRYSSPVVEYAFDRLFSSLTQAAIDATIASELGTLDALDTFVARDGLRRVRALPIGRVGILSSRTTIGVAIVPAIFALCAKCEVLVKDREDALVAAFFSTLAEELDEMRDAAIAQSWDGEHDAHDLGDVAVVVAFGSDGTLRRVRATLPPATRWIGFGTKASCGYVGRDALADLQALQHVADGAARDLMLYDTEGCLSLHVLFVERGGAAAPADFTGILGRAIERASVEFPPSAFDASHVATVAGARNLAAFRVAAAQGGTVYSDAAASYLVVLDPPRNEPPFFLPRALGVHSVDSPSAAAEYVERHRIPIEAIAVAGMRPDVTEMALRIGAARIAPFGALQSPPLDGYHGGRPRIAEFVRWVSDET
jgi:hypothetical protein